MAGLTPRKLRLFRIIDEGRFDKPDPTLDAPPGLDSAGVAWDADAGNAVHRVTGSVASQRFWQSPNLPPEPPDLLLVDLNFANDSSSALRLAEGMIPTGLLHALPFLAWARTSRRIAAVAFHSGNKGDFTTRSGAASPIMKLLAAELGAIAGSVHGSMRGEFMDSGADRLLPPADGSELDSAAYRWLLALAEPEERLARLRALAEYRRLLLQAADPGPHGGGAGLAMPRVVADPEACAQLLEQIERAAARTDPIRPEAEGWPALVLIRDDGTRDPISIASLFADAKGGLQPADFSDQAATPGMALWELRNGRPAAGSYIRALAQWHTVFEQAAAFAGSLPLGHGRPKSTLRDMIHDGVVPPANEHRTASPVSHAQTVRMLTVLFQIIRQHKAAVDSWPQLYHQEVWDIPGHDFRERVKGAHPQNAEEPESKRALRDKTLPKIISRLFITLLEMQKGVQAPLSNYEEELEIPSENLKKVLREAGIRGEHHKRFYSDLMEELRLLSINRTVGKHGQSEEILIPREVLQAVGRSTGPQAIRKVEEFVASMTPRPFPRKSQTWLASLGIERKTLTENCGYDGSGDTAIRRTLAEGLGLANNKKAAEFLTEFERGTGRHGWLRELCRQYAVAVLGWTDEETWPSLLKGG